MRKYIGTSTISKKTKNSEQVEGEEDPDAPPPRAASIHAM